MEIDGDLELVTVTEPAGALLDRGDLGIQSFGHGVGNAMLEIGQHIGQVTPMQSASCARSKEECLNRMIFVGQASLRRAIGEFVAHYHMERNHQGVENQLLQPRAKPSVQSPQVQRRQRLGGMPSFYCGAVA